MYVRQREPRGLGDAIRYAEPFVGEDAFAVLLGDDINIGPKPCARVLLEAHERLGGSILALQQVSRERIGRYGMVLGEKVEPVVVRVEEIVEKPTVEEVRSTLATMGCYVLTPTVFRYLEQVKPRKDGEVQLTDAIAALLKTEDVYGVLFEGRRYDVGDKARWLRANLELAMEREELWRELGEGVPGARAVY